MKPGDRMRQRRIELGLSQEDVAEKCSFSGASRYSNYENNYRMPSREVLEQIAIALDTTVSKLLYGTDIQMWEVVSSKSDKIMREHNVVNYVPLIKWELAGKWKKDYNNFSSKDVEGFLPYAGKVNPSIFALKVIGDSMQLKDGGKYSFSEGDRLLFDSEREPKSNDIVLVNLPKNSDQFIVKKYVTEGGKHYLISIHQDLPMLTIEDKEPIIAVLCEMTPKSFKY